MTSLLSIVLKALADFALLAAATSVNSASWFAAYQPEAPASLFEAK